MAKPGPKPKPNAIKIYEGLPGKRPLSNNELTPKDGKIESPFPLTRVGRTAWNKILKAAPEGLIKPCDAMALWQLCDAWSDYFVAVDLLKKHDVIAVSEKGGSYQHPAVGMKNKASDRIHRLNAVFGFAPSCRVGLDVKESSPADILQAIISGQLDPTQIKQK